MPKRKRKKRKQVKQSKTIIMLPNFRKDKPRVFWGLVIFLISSAVLIGIIYLKPFFTYAYNPGTFEINIGYEPKTDCIKFTSYGATKTIIDSIKDEITIEIDFEKKCDIDYLKLKFETTNLKTYSLTLEGEQKEGRLSKANPEVAIFKLNGSEIELNKHQNIKATFEVENSKYTYYTIYNDFVTDEHELSFKFSELMFIADENSFAQRAGNVLENKPILHRYGTGIKNYKFKGPVLKFWFNPILRGNYLIFDIGYVIITGLYVASLILIVEGLLEKKK